MILRSVGPTNTCQSHVARLKREFPFKKTLLSIRENCPGSFSRQGCDDHEELMVLLGAILRDGDQELRALAEQLLEGRRQGFGASSQAKDAFSFAYPKLQPKCPTAASGRDISALKEFGDKIGEVPRYRVLFLRENPPTFEAVLWFNGGEFRGMGGSKPKAKQEAASKACEKFAELMKA